MKEQIRRLISDGKTEQALKLLLKLTEKLPDKDLYDEVIHHKAVFSRSTKKERLGTETSADENIAYAKMNQALLGVLNQIPEDETSAFDSNKVLARKSTPPIKTIGIALAVVALLTLAYFVFKPPKEIYRCNERECVDCLDCYSRGCFEEADRCFKAKKSLTEEEKRKNEVASIIIEADNALAKGDWDLALSFYLEAIELDTKVEIYRKKAITGIKKIQQGDIALRGGKLSEAKSSYEDAQAAFLGLAPEHSNIDIILEKKLEEIEDLEKVPKPCSLRSLLEGKWLQSKSGKNGQIIGELNFKFLDSEDTPVVRYQNKYADGSIHRGELIDLKFSPDKNLVEGIWHNFDTDRKGAFYFEVDTNMHRLRGKYSLSLDEKPTYYWNGNMGASN